MKRDYWLSLQRALKKGKIKIVFANDGKPMYVPTTKGRDIKHYAELYEKSKEGV